MKNYEGFSSEIFRNKFRTIIFFGSNHSKDSLQISAIKKEVIEFNPEIILVEGNYNLADYSSEEEAIEKGGEAGFISYFAKKEKIKLLSNDPSTEEDLNFLAKRYGKDFSFLYFFLRDTSFYKKLWPIPKNKIDEITIKNLKETSGWKDYNFSLENLQKIYLEVFNEEYHLDKDYSGYFNPTLPKNKMTEATEKITEFRDKFMLDLIKKLLKTNNKIFIIKGNYHLEKCGERIKNLLK